MEMFDEFDINLTGIDGEALHPTRFTALQSLLTIHFGDNFSIESAARLKSKKNVVLHLNIHSEVHKTTTSLVGKLFVSGNFENELDKLKTSNEAGLSVPNVIGAENGVILMTFIPGDTLVNLINRTFQPEILDELALWYYRYHNVHAMVKGDPRLRNFIWNDNRLFGLDFEESKRGHWMLDIAGIAASLLDTNPVNDKRKRALVWRFLEKYTEHRGIARTQELDKLFIKTIADTLAQTSEWREDQEIFQMSEDIRRYGIP